MVLAISGGRCCIGRINCFGINTLGSATVPCNNVGEVVDDFTV